jgi:hypothetical protein
MINSDRGRLLDRQVAPLLALENAGDTTGFRRGQPACSARRVHTLPGFKITNPGRLWPASLWSADFSGRNKTLRCVPCSR